MFKNKGLFLKTELKQLLEKENSCVVLKSAVLEVLLVPCYMNDVPAGLKHALHKKLKSYNSKLEGIILGFDNIKVNLDEGRFAGRNAEICYPVSCNCYVFQPVVGSLLEGVVNRTSDDHIGCVCHKYFNATIRRPDDEACDNWNSKPIAIGQSITFRVKELDYTGLIPIIKGEIGESKRRNSETHAASSESGVEDIYPMINDTKKNREEKESVPSSSQTPKKNFGDFEDLRPILNGETGETEKHVFSSESGVEDIITHKKKSKKKKEKTPKVVNSTEIAQKETDNFEDNAIESIIKAEMDAIKKMHIPSSESGGDDFNHLKKKKKKKKESAVNSTKLPQKQSDNCSDSGLDFDFLSPIPTPQASSKKMSKKAIKSPSILNETKSPKKTGEKNSEPPTSLAETKSPKKTSEKNSEPPTSLAKTKSPKKTSEKNSEPPTSLAKTKSPKKTSEKNSEPPTSLAETKSPKKTSDKNSEPPTSLADTKSPKKTSDKNSEPPTILAKTKSPKKTNSEPPTVSETKPPEKKKKRKKVPTIVDRKPPQETSKPAEKLDISESELLRQKLLQEQLSCLRLDLSEEPETPSKKRKKKESTSVPKSKKAKTIKMDSANNSSPPKIPLTPAESLKQFDFPFSSNLNNKNMIPKPEATEVKRQKKERKTPKKKETKLNENTAVPSAEQPAAPIAPRILFPIEEPIITEFQPTDLQLKIKSRFESLHKRAQSKEKPEKVKVEENVTKPTSSEGEPSLAESPKKMKIDSKEQAKKDEAAEQMAFYLRKLQELAAQQEGGDLLQNMLTSSILGGTDQKQGKS